MRAPLVEHAVSGFTEALFEAVAIVLAISFFSLGLRAGLVVAIAIPLVLAITFVAMAYAGIPLQRISLGALIPRTAHPGWQPVAGKMPINRWFARSLAMR